MTVIGAGPIEFANLPCKVSYRALMPGDPAPWFRQRTRSTPSFTFDTAAGRYIVFGFLGSMAHPRATAAMEQVHRHRTLFDDQRMSFFGVTADPADFVNPATLDDLPGLRFFLDTDLSVSRLYGSAPIEQGSSGPVSLRGQFVVLDPALNVIAIFRPSADDPGCEALYAFLSALPPVGQLLGVDMPVPIILLQNVFEPDLCRHLISLYEANGGTESGFMREVNGKTIPLHDHAHKRRRDHIIEEAELIKTLQARIQRWIVPAIAKVHQFHVTRMERYIVGCYTAEDGGHFRAHRDNTTKGTAHRRFAVSINLNADFEGGEVSFPEFSPRSFKPPPGGAAIFSCSLLHQVSRVTRGRRYAFLPFLYDDAAAELRARNLQFLESGGESGT